MWHARFYAMSPDRHPRIHAELIWRGPGVADRSLAAFDNVPGMNIDEMPTLAAVAAACGDQLVARIGLVAIDGGGSDEVGVQLAIP